MFPKNISCISSRKQAVTESVIHVILNAGLLFGFVLAFCLFFFFKDVESCDHKEKQIPIFPVTFPNRFMHLSYPPEQKILSITKEHTQTETVSLLT